jgi:hypothetical protein
MVQKKIKEQHIFKQTNKGKNKQNQQNEKQEKPEF